MMASSRVVFGFLNIFSNHMLWYSNAQTKPKSLKMSERSDHKAGFAAQICELRETCLAIISGNVVAYRDDCEAGFAKSPRDRDLMVRVSRYLLELGNSVAATPDGSAIDAIELMPALVGV
jgi:hypothetical protein